MTGDYEIIIANPAGNITIIVLTPTPRNLYKDIANKLLDIDFGEYCHWEDIVYGEQVAFILPNKEIPELEMCGLEFCGNASRSFAYYRAACCGDSSKVKIKASGCEHVLEATVDINQGDSKIEMPIPSNFTEITLPFLGTDKTAFLVNMDGISHMIMPEYEATEELFQQIKDYVYANISAELPAFGVMFMDTKAMKLNPVVYVKAVDTTYFEGSCASGTTAAALILAGNEPDGEYDLIFEEPSGILKTHVVKELGQVVKLELSGPVELSGRIRVKL